MSNRTHTTLKGTELPLLNLRGRDYLEVKYRVVWFREEHPDWAILTDIVSIAADACTARAEIRDQNGRVIATSHKVEDKKGFPDFMEKAETGAIGRALALVGYGTQFCADELDEGDRIVDAPLAPKIPKSLISTQSTSSELEALENYRVPQTFSRIGGKLFKELGIPDIQVSLDYWKERGRNSPQGGLTGAPRTFVDNAERYIALVRGKNMTTLIEEELSPEDHERVERMIDGIRITKFQTESPEEVARHRANGSVK